nr:hypothetical protein [Tanacetum cinerariifolium]
MDENGRDLVNGVAGMEVDSGGNGYSNSDVMDVDDVRINLSKSDANCDFHEEVRNSKECDGSPYLEMITEVSKNKISVMGLGNDDDKVLDGANGCEMNESNVRSFTDEHEIRMVEVDKKKVIEDGKDIESNSSKQGVKNDLDINWEDHVELETTRYNGKQEDFGLDDSKGERIMGQGSSNDVKTKNDFGGHVEGLIDKEKGCNRAANGFNEPQRTYDTSNLGILTYGVKAEQAIGFISDHVPFLSTILSNGLTEKRKIVVIQNPNRMMTNSGRTPTYSSEQPFTYGIEFEIKMNGLNGNPLLVDLETTKMNEDRLGHLKFDISWPKRRRKGAKCRVNNRG